ncbi:MAG: PmoA family protein [Novipirellula sp. JB048]
MEMLKTPVLKSLRWVTLASTAVALAAVAPADSAAETPAKKVTVSVSENDSAPGWNVYDDGELFAGYLANFNGFPIVYPVIGPGGHAMTRDFPMKEGTEGERLDHVHHRSMWFTHGEVNGVDFWVDDSKEGAGRIVQTAGTARVDEKNNAVIIRTENDWNDSTGQRQLSDTRRTTFRAVDGKRIIDFEVVMQATDGDVNFGDTKEGSLGIRVASTIKVDAKLGGKITNAEGLTDSAAWAKRSNWVNYSGPVDNQPVGMTVFYHPSSFAAPCNWHVRTYGLFAANPFGHYHFVGGEKTAGTTLKSGESMSIRCRVILYEGEFDAEKTAEAFAQYAAQEPTPL